MKRLLFILFFGSITGLYAQNIYVPGEIAKGKTAVYRCKAYTKFWLEVIDETDVSTICTEGWDALPGNHDDAVRDILREELTEEEWNSIKGKVAYGLTFTFVIDKQGKIRDWVFTFRTTDPVFTKFEPDRLYQLEQRLKETLLRIWSESGKSWKNLIYIQSLKYSDI